MSDETKLDLEGVRARRQAVKNAKGFTEMYDAISRSYADIDALMTEVEALRNTQAAFLGAMQHIFDNAHYINERDDEYELRERLEQIEKWARRFEGVDVTQPFE